MAYRNATYKKYYCHAKTVIFYDNRISPLARVFRIAICEAMKDGVVKSWWKNTRLNKTLDTGPAITDTSIVIQDFFKDLQQKLDRLFGGTLKIKDKIHKNRRIIGAIAVATLIATLGKKYYRRAVHGSCSQFGGKELVLCRLKRIREFQRAIDSQKQYCSKTSDPEKCKERLKSAILKLQKERSTWLKKI
jgi:hypothetical protein